MSEKVYYETGQSNTGDIEKYATKREAMRRAQQIANEVNEKVFIEKRTDDDLIDYYSVEPKKGDRK